MLQYNLTSVLFIYLYIYTHYVKKIFKRKKKLGYFFFTKHIDYKPNRFFSIKLDKLVDKFLQKI